MSEKWEAPFEIPSFLRERAAPKGGEGKAGRAARSGRSLKILLLATVALGVVIPLSLNRVKETTAEANAAPTQTEIVVADASRAKGVESDAVSTSWTARAAGLELQTPAVEPTAVAVTQTASAPVDSAVHGVTDKEIRFGISAPFAGANRESGRQLKMGVEAAFAEINENGGIEGRQLRPIAEDDNYEPSKTLTVMQDLYEKQNVFGFIDNYGTATAAVAVPYALAKRALFFTPYTGASLLRQDPPDRYVFNFRPSYAEETAAAVRYLLKVKRIPASQIAVFAQSDAFGDAGFEGVAKALRAHGDPPDSIPRFGYKRNTIDVDDAVAQFKATKGRIKAVVMVATYRAAAKFIEKTRDAAAGVIFTNTSAVGATSLAEELMLLGPRYAQGVIVTQDTPAVGGSATFVLRYKAALAKYFPGEAPDYTSFEAYIDANILAEALKRCGRQVDTERLVDTLESMREFDLGLGAPLHFSLNEHQASHKVWGTQLDEKGHYQPIDLE